MTKMLFGKYKDQDLSSVPEDYLNFLISKCKADIALYEGEIQRRDAVMLASGTMMEQIVKLGFRALMKQHHPDTGGDPKKAQQVNAANEKLKELLSPSFPPVPVVKRAP